ncbi:MAG: hypothetical protein ACJ74P_12135 [Gaiellaceae bacterium]
MFLGLAGFLVSLGSVGTVQKYAGTGVAIVYLLAVTILTPLLVSPLLRQAERHLAGVRGYTAATVVFVVLAAVLVVVYPHANTHVPGQGSDRDDSIGLGARALLHGHQPYAQRTYLGNPVDQGPTVLAIAAPFAAFTAAGWQNLLWLALLLVFLVRLSSPGVAAAVLAFGFIAAPAVPRDYVTGGDLLANPVYIAAAAWVAYRSAKTRWWLFAAVILGIALGSRPNWMFLLIPLAVALTRKGSLRIAARTVGIAAFVGAVIYAPVVVTRTGRSALTVANMLHPLGHFGQYATVALAAVFALWLALRQQQWSAPVLFWQMALVQALFAFALVVHASVASRTFDASRLVSGYGVPATVLVLLAVAATAVAEDRAPASARRGRRLGPVDPLRGGGVAEGPGG